METRDLLRIASARTHSRTGTGRQLRLAAELTKAEVASAVGVSEDTIRRWEEAKNAPRGIKAAKWADLLDQLAETYSASPAA